MDYRKIVVFTLLLVNSVLFSISDNDAYLNIRNAYNDLSHFTADISQINTFRSEDIKIESQGVFYYNKDRIAIKYTKPQIQEIYMNGNKVLFYDKDSNSCIELQNNESQTMLNPLYMIDKYWKYSDKKIEKRKEDYKIVLRPLQEKDFTQIDVYIDKKTFLVIKLVYTDIGENIVEISFKNINTIDEVSEDIWKLNLPDDVKYIKR